MSEKKAIKEKNTKEKNTKVKAAKETLDRQLEEKRSLAGEIIRRLELEYPDAGCTLDYNQRPSLRTWKKQGEGYQRLHEDPLGGVRRKCAGRFRASFKAAGRGKKKRQPDHGRCIWETGDRNGYPLHPPCEPDGVSGSDQGT